MAPTSLTKLAFLAVLATALSATSSVHAAAALDTWVGVVGGAGNGSISQGCTTYGAPASLSFFTFNGFAVPQAGIAACGYSGTVTQTTAVNGPLVASGTAGTVRYRFSVDGLSTSLGAPGPYLFGDTYVVLDVQQNLGPVYEVLNAHVGRGNTGTISGTNYVNPVPEPANVLLMLTGLGALVWRVRRSSASAMTIGSSS